MSEGGAPAAIPFQRAFVAQHGGEGLGIGLVDVGIDVVERVFHADVDVLPGS